MKKIGIIGSGTWGTALAKLLCENGHEITLWSAIKSEVENLVSTHIHPNLPQIVLPTEIQFTTDIEKTCKEKDFVICAVPSVYVRSSIHLAVPFIEKNTIVISVTKGIEENSLLTMTEVISDELEKAGKHLPIAALSGPTHAEEVAA